MAKNKGICAICGKGTKLTFEHVPPRAAGNVDDATVYGIEEWLSRDLQTGEMPGGYVQPQGTGNISICKPCNEYSGAWFVPEFAKFTHAGIAIFRQLQQQSLIDEADKSLEWKVVDFGIMKMRALSVTKQIVASLLAINDPGFAERNPALREFVLDRERRGLPDRYRLYACLFAGPLARFVGLSGELNVETRKTIYQTELAHPPFAYLLTVDSEPSQPISDITEWTTRGDAEERDERVEMIVGFGHTGLPGDYRTKAKVDAETAANLAALKQQQNGGNAD